MPVSSEEVQALLDKGWEPIPLRGKRPMEKGWAGKPGPAPSAKVWRTAERVGLKMGAALAIDIDVKGPRAPAEVLQGLVQELNLPRTWTQRTPSGGLHLVYRLPEAAGRIKNKVGWRAQVDIRAAGGQIALYSDPPNLEELETAPIELLDALRAKVSGGSSGWDDMIAAGESFELPQVILSGQRNDTLYRYACSLLAKGETLGAMRKEVAKANEDRCDKPIPAKELESLLTSAAEWWAKEGEPARRAEEAKEDKQVRKNVADTLGAAEEKSPLEALQDRYVYVIRDNTVFDLRTREWLGLEGFRNSYPQKHKVEGKKRGTLAEAWLLSGKTRRAHLVVYEPGRPEVYVEDGVGHVLNLWTPPAVPPIQGDVQIFLEHLDLLCGPEEAKHLIKWLAHLVQRPDEPIGHAALIISQTHGTGKSLIAWVMGQILGPSNVVPLSNALLKSGYTGWAEGKCLVVVHEIKMSGSWESLEEIKTLISEDRIIINDKYRRAYAAKNWLNWLAFSNHLTAVHLERTDRRWWVCISPMEDKQSPEYYERLWSWAKGDGAAALHHYLLHEVDLGQDWDRVRWDPPVTRGKRVVEEASLGPVAAWLREQWELRTGPFKSELVQEGVVREAVYAEFGRGEATQVRAWLRDHSAGRLQVRTSSGRRRVYVMDNLDRWRKASTEEIDNELKRALT